MLAVYCRATTTSRAAFDLGQPRQGTIWLHSGRILLFGHQSNFIDSFIVYVCQEQPGKSSRVEPVANDEDGGGDLFEVFLRSFIPPWTRFS